MSSIAIMTVGCPGSGKTTFARTLDPHRFVILSLDDFRTALWGSKKVYHSAVDTDTKPDDVGRHPMRELLRTAYDHSLHAALAQGWNVCLANTHLYPSSFKQTMHTLAMHEAELHLRVYLMPLDELLDRNSRRPPEDWCDPAYITRCHEALHARNAWWRSHPCVSLEIVR